MPSIDRDRRERARSSASTSWPTAWCRTRSTSAFCTTWSRPSWPAIVRVRLPPRPGARSPAPPPSSGGRRAPAGLAWAPARWRTSPAAAWPSRPSRAATRRRSTRRSRRRPSAWRWATWWPAARCACSPAPTFAEPSTKRAAGIIGKAGSTGPCWCWWAGDEVAALKSFRNLAGTRALTIGDAEVQDYVWAKSLLFTEAAVSFLEGGLNEGGEA